MSSTDTLTIITLLIVISIFFSAISYSRQQAMKKRKLLINKYRLQADEACAYIELLLKFDEAYLLIMALQTTIVNALASAVKLAPDDELLNHNLETQKSRLQLYKSGQRHNQVTCYAVTDSELNQSIGQLSMLGKLLDIHRNRGTLSVTKHQTLQTHLQLLKVKLTINSHLYQADCFAEENEVTMYQMHIKQALEVLKKSPLESEDKNSQISLLSKRLNDVKRTNKIITNDKLIKPDNATQLEESNDTVLEKSNDTELENTTK